MQLIMKSLYVFSGLEMKLTLLLQNTANSAILNYLYYSERGALPILRSMK